MKKRSAHGIEAMEPPQQSRVQQSRALIEAFANYMHHARHSAIDFC